MKGKPKSQRFIVTRQADVAAFFGKSIDTVKSWAKQGMPGKSNAYDLSVIAQWLREEGPWKARGQQALGDDALLDGDASSPALEKLRAAKAALAELDLQERRGTLLSVEQSKDIGLRWASLIKRLGERLGKRFGRDAAAAINETLEECERVLVDGYTRPADPKPDNELVAGKRKAAVDKTDKPVGRRGGSRSKRPS